MRYMIDTNVILDVYLGQEPFLDASRRILRMCEDGKIQGFVSASAVTDLFYVVRRRLHSADKAYTALGHVLNIVKVLTVTGEDVNTAFLRRAPDFEDCLMAVCALSGRCDAIVTRNKADFEGLGISLLSPEEALAATAN